MNWMQWTCLGLAVWASAQTATAVTAAPVDRLAHKLRVEAPDWPEEDSARRRERAIRAITKAGGRVIFRDGAAAPASAPVREVQLAAAEFDNNLLSWLRELSEVQILRLSYIYERLGDEGLECLAGLKLQSLKELELRNCRAISDNGLAQIARLPTLRTLNLSGTRITDAGLRHLARLPALTNLSLLQTTVDGSGSKHLRELSRLEDLDLSHTRVRDDTLAHLAGHPTLRTLRLTRTQVTTAGIQRLGRLKLSHLYLEGTRVDDSVFAAAATQFPNLVWLELACTDVTDEGLKTVLPRWLYHLGLAGTDVTDEGLAALKGLTILSDLDCGGTLVGDKGLEHLKAHPKLRRLCLHATRVGDAGLKKLESLTSLQELDLSSTAITDAGLVHLHGLSRLTGLDLSGTAVRDQVSPLALKLPALRRLDVRRTAVGRQHLERLRERGALTVTSE